MRPTRFHNLVRSLLIAVAVAATTDVRVLQAETVRVFLLAGQSNMEGLGQNSQLSGALAAPLPGVKIWRDDVGAGRGFVDLEPGFGSGTGRTGGGSRFGPELGFGHRLAEAFPGETIYLVKYAVGGTNLHEQWNPETGAHFETFAEVTSRALGELDSLGVDFTLEAMLWTQGERDTRFVNMADAYEENLPAFIEAVRIDQHAPEMPFFLSRLSSQQTDLPAATLATVRAAQQATAAADPLAIMIDTDAFGMGTDNLHFNTAGMLALGEAFADRYLAQQGVPEPASAVLLLCGAIVSILMYRPRR